MSQEDLINSIENTPTEEKANNVPEQSNIPNPTPQQTIPNDFQENKPKKKISIGNIITILSFGIVAVVFILLIISSLIA